MNLSNPEPANLGGMAWETTRHYAVTYLVGLLIAIVGWTVLGGLQVWEWYICAAICLAVVALSGVVKSMPPRFWAWLFVGMSGAILLACIYNSYLMAQVGGRFLAPLIGFKLMAMAMAVAPPRPTWTGYTVIGLCGLLPVLFLVFLPGALRPGISVLEPWHTLLYTVIAAFLLRQRLKAIELEKSLATVQAQKHAMDELAQIMLALRDLTNTPLQAIDLTAALLEKGHLSSEAAAAHLQAAIAKLRDLSHTLESYEGQIDWQIATPSFTAKCLLGDKARRNRLSTYSKRD
jgi:hypothetical protein